MSKVLFAIEDLYIRDAIKGIVGRIPGVYAVFEDSGIEAIKTLLDDVDNFDSVVLYSEKVEMGVIDIARLIRNRFGKLPIAIMASHDDIHTKINSTSLGRIYFIGTNFDDKDMRNLLESLEKESMK